MNEMILSCVPLRHGMTRGNQMKTYVGRSTDEPLCEEGIEELKTRRENGLCPAEWGTVVSSPMLRCRQTAFLLTGEEPARLVSGLEEIDFGSFEGHTWQELSKEPDYCRWVESGGTLPFPGGESREEFVRRTMTAFRQCIRAAAKEHTERTTVFCHGGSIMAIMSELTGGDYWSFQPKCGEGYEVILRITEETIHVISYSGIPAGDPA